MIDIAIMGNRIAGNLAAAYLKQYQPNAQIAVIGPPGTELPSVGESTVECTVMFMKDIGILDWLDETQAPKGGLTFYYKVGGPSAKDNYWALETPVVLKAVSKQLNRPVLDDFLRHRNVANGVQYVPGRVKNVELAVAGALHRIEVRNGEETTEIRAHYVIDATGRSQVLGRKLTSIAGCGCDT
jgi:flavin-dependent dehydrogenase